MGLFRLTVLSFYDLTTIYFHLRNEDARRNRMSPELQRARRRQTVIFLLICVAMVVLLGRLYYWQAIRSDQLTRWANAEHTQNQVVEAPRGTIYDSAGIVLATNVIRDDVYIEPLQFASDNLDGEQSKLELQKIVSKLHQ